MRTIRISSLFVFLVSSLFLFAGLPAFAGDGALEVKCVDASGGPVPGVKVVIFHLQSQKQKDKKSEAQGIAEFTKLDDGAYRIIGRKEGLAPALYEFAVLKGSRESVVLKFEPGADRKLYFEDPATEAQAFELVKQGLEAYKQKKFPDAEKLFAQSLEVNPANPEAFYYQAVSMIQQAKFNEAVEKLNQCARLASVFMTLPSPSPSGPNPYEQTYRNAQNLIRQMPIFKGENALRQKQYDVAAEEFRAAIKTDPNNPEFHANLAIALTNAKKFDEGLEAVENAIRLKPSEKAYADLKNQISARKENMKLETAQSLMDEGNRLLQGGDAAGALKKYEEAKGMVPPDKQSPLWRQIGRSQAKLGQQAAAVESLKKAIELAPADKVSEYRNALAQHYLDAKNYEASLDVLTDPQSAGSQSVEQVLTSLAQSMKNKDPQFAEAAMERILKLNPDNADIYFELGQMYYADGKEKDSRTKELLTKYVEIGKDAAKVQSAKDLLIMVNRRSK
jgi:tetratricopeptide (TPR) repeat protein